MSDEKLRELERKWKESGSAADGYDYLTEMRRVGASESERIRLRVEIGDLTRDRVELAAFVGHSPALEALGQAVDPELLLHRLSSHSYVREHPPCLGRWGKEACVRAAIAAARIALERWRRLLPGKSGPLAAVEAAEAWVQKPTEENALRAEELARLVLQTSLLESATLTDKEEAGLAFSAAQAAWLCASTIGSGEPELTSAEAVGYAAWYGHADAVGAIQCELAKWILG